MGSGQSLLILLVGAEPRAGAPTVIDLGQAELECTKQDAALAVLVRKR